MGSAADGEGLLDAASFVQQNCPVPVHDGEVIPGTARPGVLNIKCTELYLDHLPFLHLDDIHLVERVVVVVAIAVVVAIIIIPIIPIISVILALAHFVEIG